VKVSSACVGDKSMVPHLKVSYLDKFVTWRSFNIVHGSSRRQNEKATGGNGRGAWECL